MKTKTVNFKMACDLVKRAKESKPKTVFMRDWWTTLIVAGLDAVKK